MTEEHTRYAYVGNLPPQIDDDPPAKRQMIAMMREDGEAKATEEGYPLGQPTYHQQPTVIVPNWNEDGLDFPVSPEVARLTGLDPDTLRPGPTRLLIEWPIIEPRDDGIRA